MKIRKSIITLIILIFSIFVLGNVKSYAATGSFTLNTSSVSLKKGKSTTVTLTVKNCEGTFTVSSSDSSIATVSVTDNDSDGDGWITSTATIKVTGKKKGTATISVTTSDVADTDANEVTGTKTIKVSVTEDKKEDKKEDKPSEDKDNQTNSNSNNSNNNSNSSNSKPTEIKLSSDATLKNLGITPTKYDFSGFKKNITSYEVKVPYEAEKITIYADASYSKATVTGIGTKSLQLGENTFKVKVTAEDKKTTKTYTLKITRKKEAEISTDATLKNLGITPAEHDFSGFRKMTTSYSVKVPYEAKEIKIYADASDPKATVTGTGTKILEVGENSYTIKVTAEDKKTTKIYTLKITREEEKEPIENEEPVETENENIEDKTIGLTNVEVKGLELTPKFSNDIYEYNLNDLSDISSLDITTEKSSDDITVDIVGNEDLKIGENIITILVYNSKQDKTTTYQIIANIEESEIDLTDVNNSISSTQRQLIAKRSIIIGSIIIIGVLIVAFIVKRNKILSKNEFIEYNKSDRIDLSSEETMFERINENSEITKIKKKKSKGKRFK